ncbi:MAG: type II toxin-antitoxin system VapB family antitoxin [Verrucomicrobia bacterium]|nr:type II toxin-antitoxin system VapB family antitoxin [Verrucomicrobiota bacterium]
MKTTVEIDEVKLDAVMTTAGFKTRKETIDWALNEALRIATINKIVESPWTMEEAKAAVDPSYDVIALRNLSPVPVKHSKPSRRK